MPLLENGKNKYSKLSMLSRDHSSSFIQLRAAQHPASCPRRQKKKNSFSKVVIEGWEERGCSLHMPVPVLRPLLGTTSPSFELHLPMTYCHNRGDLVPY